MKIILGSKLFEKKIIKVKCRNAPEDLRIDCNWKHRKIFSRWLVILEYSDI